MVSIFPGGLDRFFKRWEINESDVMSSLLSNVTVTPMKRLKTWFFHIQRGYKREQIYLPIGEESDSSLTISCLCYAVYKHQQRF